MSITSLSKKETSSPTLSLDPIGIIGNCGTVNTSISLKQLKVLSLKYRDGEITIRLNDGEIQYVKQTISKGSVKKAVILGQPYIQNSSSPRMKDHELRTPLEMPGFKKKTS
jgi:hypothetical protein